MSDLGHRLERGLSEAERSALRHAVRLAQTARAPLYLAGGGVRDLLRGNERIDVDLDLVVEGDAVALATALAREVGARVVAHGRFGTAVVRGDGFRFDFARARSERYERPGALPAVRPASLADDLARRDFTINAMALRLGGPDAGGLIDPHGGSADLRDRLLRALHPESFRDDATRILRAFRYAGRLDLRVERRTGALLRRDLAFLDTISGARLRRELELIAAEERPERALRLGARAGALRALHPALDAGPAVLRAVTRLREVAPAQRDAALFALLLSEASAAEVEGAIVRLSLTARQAGAVRGLLALRSEAGRLARAALRPSEAVALLDAHPVAAIEAFALLHEGSPAGERARRYLGHWRLLRPRLNGRDVEALGVPHGPRVGEAIAVLRAARLDGRTASREDEEALVRDLLSARRQAAGARRG